MKIPMNQQETSLAATWCPVVSTYKNHLCDTLGGQGCDDMMKGVEGGALPGFVEKQGLRHRLQEASR